MGKKFLALASVICLALILVALPLVAACEEEVTPPAEEEEEEEEAPQMELKIGQIYSEGLHYDMVEEFVALVGQNSDGRLKLTHYVGDLLGDWTAQLEATARGTQDFALTWGSASLDPLLELIYLPTMVFTWEQAEEAYGRGNWLYDVYSDVCEEANLKLVLMKPDEFVLIASRDAITPEPDSVRGVKIRVPPIAVEVTAMEAVGFSPVTIPFSELHTALQTGMVDMRATAYASEIYTMRDVLRHVYNYRYAFYPCILVMNLDLWNDMSPEDQEAIEKAADTIEETIWARAKAYVEQEKQKLLDEGVEWVELTPAQLRLNMQLMRDALWAPGGVAEQAFGEEIMDRIRQSAPPIP
jgi:TRAP-type C4-dicarboxylate transport system substrate-binding protein